MKISTLKTTKTVGSLIGLSLLTIAMNACGVRQDESTVSTIGAATADASVSSGGTSLPVTTDSTSNGDSSSTFPVFSDAYTGFWENRSRLSDQDPQIIRIIASNNYYQIDTYTDVSSGGVYFNCYVHYDNTIQQVVRNGLGLRLSEHVDKITDYAEWTLDGKDMQLSAYDDNGELINHIELTATFTKVFEGLAANDIQLCY